MDYTAHYDSPLGGITLGSDGKALIGLWFDGQKYFTDVLDKEHREEPSLPIFVEPVDGSTSILKEGSRNSLLRLYCEAAISVRQCGGDCWKSLTDRL